VKRDLRVIAQQPQQYDTSFATTRKRVSHSTMMMSKQHHQLKDIAVPHDHDVLSGRGNFVNYHAGNEFFRALVRKHKVAYVACPKPQKGKFSRMILNEIRCLNPPGRFLKQDSVSKMWYDIGEKKALDKTRQALREGAPEIMKEIGDDESSENPASSPLSRETTPKVTMSHDQAPPPPPPMYNSTPPMNNRSSRFGNGYEHYTPAAAPALSAPTGLSHYPTEGTRSTAMRHPGQMMLYQQMQHYQQSNMRNNLFSTQTMAGQQGNPQHIVSRPLPHNHMPTEGLHQQEQEQSHRNHHLHINTVRQVTECGPNLQGRMGDSSIHCHEYLANGRETFDSKISFDDFLEPRPIFSGHVQQRQQDQQDHIQLHEFQQRQEEQHIQPPQLPLRPHPLKEIYSKLYEELPESLGPLPNCKRQVRKGLERDNSEKSIQVDSIFQEMKHSESAGQVNGGASAQNLSIMSLSIGDMNVTSEPTNADSLAAMLNSSLRVGSRKTGRQSGSVGEANNSDLAHVMDMSVATLGDRLSDFGDTSLPRMSESQSNMSFVNVFEETEKDLFAGR
jgi:hypothetical protein